jgi:DNA repair protein SbcC/Rad50
MFSKIFKKDDAPTAAELEAEAALAAAEASNAQYAADKALWEQRLAGAGADESALLNIAIESPVTVVKVDAVSRLTSESFLKSAEREFRTHDRRVYRIAKQRYELCVARRENNEAAEKLIDTARTLQADANIPANRLVELDHAWQALDHALIAESVVADYNTHIQKLTALTRERGEAQLAISRWCAEALGAIGQLDATCVDVITGAKSRDDLAAQAQRAHAAMAAMPSIDAGFAASQKTKSMKDVQNLAEQLAVTLAKSAQVDQRMGILDELAQNSSKEAAARWRALSPIADAAMNDALNARFHAWERTQADAAEAHKTEVRAGKKAEKDAKTEALAAIVTAAETTLAAGQLAETNKLLVTIDETESTTRATGALRARIDAIQAEYARLKGWQHWGGGVVRDELVAEAETLAKKVGDEKIKLNLRSHGDDIDALRERWKELDKLGGATSRALWERFDGALKAAFVPIAAQVAKFKAQREENLAARNKLIQSLYAVTIAEAPDFKELARALDTFQSDWRKLGPVEHTTPKKSQEDLLKRMRASMARLEAPLADARRVAKLKREQLIEGAKALSANPQGRDTVTKVRELQAEWQTQAKALPLSRGVENALWKDFKAASDAIFAARDAVHSARDQEFKAHQDQREALIKRLDDLQGDVATEYKRTIAEVDTAWRKAGEAPKAIAAKLDARFRAARDHAEKRMRGIANRVWHTTCDALTAKLALCEEIESAANKEGAADRYAALAALPAKWEGALSARLNAAVAGARKENADVQNNALMQLEIALDIEPPAQFQAARRDFKLRAMKAALEGKPSTATNDFDQLIADAAGHTAADAGVRDRLLAIVSALRTKGRPQR